jgi:NADP-dependent isocitrate dehydrogenase
MATRSEFRSRRRLLGIALGIAIALGAVWVTWRTPSATEADADPTDQPEEVHDAAWSVAPQSEALTIPVAVSPPQRFDDAASGAPSADQPLPPHDTPLTEVIDELESRALRGDRPAACRLAMDGYFCRNNPLDSDSVAFFEQAIASRGRTTAADVAWIERLEAMHRRAVRLCSGLPEGWVRDHSWRYLLQGAQLGDDFLAAMYVIAPPLDPATRSRSRTASSGAGSPDHSLHRGRRHRSRHLARLGARARRGGREGLRRQAQDPLDGGVRRREGEQPLFGNWLPDATSQACRDYLVSIKGPLTTPIGGGIRSLNVALRQMLDLYVCLRPVRWFKGVPSPVKDPSQVDMVIFRENTEDIYAGIEFEHGSGTRTRSSWRCSRKHSRRNTARSASRNPRASASSRCPRTAPSAWCAPRSSTPSTTSASRVTLVHKGNIMKFTEGAFRNWGYALAEREFGDQVYTWDQWERTKAAKGRGGRQRRAEGRAGRGQGRDQGRHRRHHPAAGADPPDEFDVIATLNLNGDYLSDALAAQVGGIGIAPGGNINYVTGHAVFEATHGTAPKYANLDKVNPAR